MAATANAQLSNGGFEDGDLTDWTAGGGAVEVLQAAGLDPAVAPSEGSFFALLASGPGNNPGPGGDFDANGTGDFDASTLSIVFDLAVAPASLSFDWSFLTSELGEPGTFDDLFLVTLDGTPILARSVNKPGGVSPFQDTTPYDGTSYTVTSAGPANGSSFVDGRTPFESVCIRVDTAGTHTLQFLVADQGDSLFDSGVLIDNVAVPSACDSSLAQVTNSAGANLEVKGGGFILTPQQNRQAALSDDGTVLAFVSNGDYTFDNPNLQTQVFVAASGAFERLTAMVGGDAKSPALTSNGRFLTFAATGDLVPGNPGNADGNFEIFRFDRTLAVMTQVSDTTACENSVPTISHNNQGRRVAFATDCTDLDVGFNADGNSEIVIWDANSGSFQWNESSGCTSRTPAISQHNQGRYVTFVSNCDLTGSNADGNFEIFQWNRQNNAVTQITTTGATVLNDSPSTDFDGSLVAFVSTGDHAGTNADGNLEVFRWNRNGGGAIEQLTDTLTFFHVATAIDDSGRFVAFERFNLLAAGEVGHIDASTSAVTPVATGDPSLPAVAVEGGAVPVVAFQASGNFSGQNGDGNQEIWTTASAFAPGDPNTFCNAPIAAIPDNDPAGIVDTINLASAAVIADLDVLIRTSHTWVGDLIYALEHVDTGTTVTIVDRPGRGAVGFGCGGNDIDAVLDDEAANPVENECAATLPTIAGSFIPNELLAGFDGETYAGTWNLTVSDNAGFDTGTLVEWCLLFDSGP